MCGFFPPPHVDRCLTRTSCGAPPHDHQVFFVGLFCRSLLRVSFVGLVYGSRLMYLCHFSPPFSISARFPWFFPFMMTYVSCHDRCSTHTMALFPSFLCSPLFSRFPLLISFLLTYMTCYDRCSTRTMALFPSL